MSGCAITLIPLLAWNLFISVPVTVTVHCCSDVIKLAMRAVCEREKACDCCSDVIKLAMRAVCEREKACDCCSDVIKLAMRAVCVRERECL